MEGQEGVEDHEDTGCSDRPQDDGQDGQEPDPPPIAFEDLSGELVSVGDGIESRRIQPQEGLSQFFLGHPIQSLR